MRARLAELLARKTGAGPKSLVRMFVSPWAPLALVGTLAAAATVGGVRVWVAHALRDEAAAHAGLQRRLASVAELAASTPAAAPTPDFTQSLPVAVPVDGLVQTLQRSADALGVAVVSVSSEPHAETEQTLPKLTVDVTLRGTYPAIKSTLAEVLTRYPNAGVQRLRIKRDETGPGREEATIEVMLPLRAS